MGAVIFGIAALCVFGVAFTAAIVLVARNARDAEAAEMQHDLDVLEAEVEELRAARLADHHRLHELEVAMIDAGLTPPGRASG